MSALSIQPTFPIFTDIDGQPLEDGYIWIGVANLPPIGNPINVYWDAALTIPAALPIRTRGGYPINSGTPARLYVNSDYSIQVQNKNGSVVYSAPVATERFGDLISASQIQYTPGPDSLLTATTVQDALDDLSNRALGSNLVGFQQAGTSGTAQAGSSTTITLASGASATDDFYNGQTVYITGGLGAGQIRTISDYVGATKVATVATAWATTPDATSTYNIATARTVQAKLRETVSVKDFGAVGDGVADDTAAIQAAWAASKDLYFPAGTYYAPGLELRGSDYEIKRIQGGNVVITGDDIFIVNMFGLSMEGIRFANTGTMNLEGMRYCDWKNIEFDSFVQMGKFSSTGISSWSAYWNKFTQVKFQGGVHFNSNITDANINSNTFDTCEFRPGIQTALMKFTKPVGGSMAFSSNTFIGCDTSYAPVLNIVDTPDFWAAVFIGGYIDSGTALYLAGSLRARNLEFLSVRNPGSTALDLAPAPYSSNLKMSTGGARPKTQVPVGAVNLFPSVPTGFSGGAVINVTSVPVPYDGDYTVSVVLDDISGAGFQAIRCDNVTTGAQILGAIAYNGYSSYTFLGVSKGDVLRVVFDGDSGTNASLIQCSLTPGAGVMSVVPYRTVFPTDSTTTNCPQGVATNVASPISVGSYSLDFYKILVYTKNPATGGGGEKIQYTLAVSASSTTLVTTLTEVTRTTRNGNGGTSLAAGSFALTVTTSGLSFTLVGTMTSATAASVDATVKIYGINQD